MLSCLRPCRRTSAGLAAAMLLTVWGVRGSASDLHIGGATASITPDGPVALSGQMHTRIATTVETPVTATALALESRDGDNVLEQAIMVSCDLVAIREGILEKVRERLGPELPDFDVDKLFLSATYTHAT